MKNEFHISTDKDKLDIPKIHGTIKDSYWGGYRDMEMTRTTIENSMCFGIYATDGEQVGFARVLTDKVAFAYIMDVLVFDPYKGKGLGKMLMEYIMGHPVIENVLTIALKTKDAHLFYGPFGFKKIGDSSLWMAKDRAQLD
ncbi:MAG: GNAT family N-acetyltransferase [Flavobacteriaceae bacterium]